MRQVPLYLTPADPGARLVIGADGNPVFQGFANATFTVNIPTSLANSGKAGMILQYGHGHTG